MLNKCPNLFKWIVTGALQNKSNGLCLDIDADISPQSSFSHLDLSRCPLLHKSLQPPCVTDLQGSDTTWELRMSFSMQKSACHLQSCLRSSLYGYTHCIREELMFLIFLNLIYTLKQSTPENNWNTLASLKSTFKQNLKDNSLCIQISYLYFVIHLFSLVYGLFYLWVQIYKIR